MLVETLLLLPVPNACGNQNLPMHVITKLCVSLGWIAMSPHQWNHIFRGSCYLANTQRIHRLDVTQELMHSVQDDHSITIIRQHRHLVSYKRLAYFCVTYVLEKMYHNNSSALVLAWVVQTGCDCVAQHCKQAAAREGTPVVCPRMVVSVVCDQCETTAIDVIVGLENTLD